MPGLSEEQIATCVAPYLEKVPPSALIDDRLYERLRVYLQLLLRWNARMNLTAIRDPEEIVRRHFGESLFAGCLLGERSKSDAEVLDLGSGAGFPGIPVQMLFPDFKVVLAESQGKKAAFLREAVRVLGLQCEVFAARVETMEAGRLFDAVMLRAVDRMEAMIEIGWERVRAGGFMVEMTACEPETGEVFRSPGSSNRCVRIRGVVG